MNCHEFEDRLHRLLDDRQPPEADALLAAHAAECEPCWRLLVGQRMLLAGLRHSVAVKAGEVAVMAGEQFAERVVAAHKSEAIEAVVLDSASGQSASGQSRAWRAIMWLAATAAAVAIAVSIYLSSQPGRPNIAVTRPNSKPSASEPRGPVPGDRAVAGNRDARPQRGGRRPGLALGGFPRLPTGYGATLADMATSSIPQAVERIEEVERYAPGIRPIRVSFAMLWNALWRSIPGFGGDESDPQACWHGQWDMRRMV